jgi:hypothetical protein
MQILPDHRQTRRDHRRIVEVADDRDKVRVSDALLQEFRNAFPGPQRQPDRVRQEFLRGALHPGP